MFIKINRVVLAVGSKNNGLNHLGALAQDMLGIPPDYSIAMKHASTLLPRPPAPGTTLVGECTVRPTTGLFRTVEPNSPRTVYGLPLYRFDLCYIVYMVRNTIFHHAKVLPLGFLGAYGLPDAP